MKDYTAVDLEGGKVFAVDWKEAKEISHDEWHVVITPSGDHLVDGKVSKVPRE